MAEFLIKVADERGRLLQQVESGISEAEVRDRFCATGFSRLLGEAEEAPDRGAGAAEEAGQAVNFSDLQSAVSDTAEGRPAGPEFAGPADQTAAGRVFPRAPAECAGAGERWRVALRCVCGAGSFPKDLYDDVNGGREERQHGRSADPLHQFSAAGADVSRKSWRFR